jgi:hypothetical protein
MTRFRRLGVAAIVLQYRTAPNPRPLCLPRETTSPHPPSCCRREVAGPPARAVVCPSPAARHGVAASLARRPLPFDHPTDSGRIAAR